MKKYILTIVVFIITILSFSICYAGSYNDLLDTKYEGIVEALSFLKIVDGVSNKIFDANKVVTRAELSKMLVLAHGYDKYKDLLKAPKAFKDVKQGAWYYDYVNIATAYNLTKGYPDGKFYPDQEVTYSEAVTMILRSLGHNYIREDSEYGWDFNYIQKMREIKLNEGIAAFKNSDGAKRGDVAILIWNMLNSTVWEVIEEEGTGILTYTDSGKVLLNRAFEGEFELIDGKKIKSFSVSDKKIYVNVESIGEAELVDTLPLYAIGSNMIGVLDKNNKKIVCVSYDIDSAIVEGYVSELKEDGYKIKNAKNIYHFGGSGEDYAFLSVTRDGAEQFIDRAVVLDLDGKEIIEKTEKKDDILTINDKIKIDTAKAILLDDKTIIDWSKLSKNDAILQIISGEIYILANKYKTEEELENEKSSSNLKDNLYFIADISYTGTDFAYVKLIAANKSYRYVCEINLDKLYIGDMVLADIKDGKITKITKATSQAYKDLKLNKELILKYESKDYLPSMLGKYIVNDDTEIYVLNKYYQNNSDKIITKCTLEKVEEKELQYIDDEIIDIIAKDDEAKVIYIERECNKFLAFYARVKDVVVEKEKIKLYLSPVDGTVIVYETAGTVNCDIGDIISYTVNDKTLKINEVYRSGVIGYDGDLIVESVKNRDVYLTNGEHFSKTDSVINVNERQYKLSNYKIIVSKVAKIDDKWKFVSANFADMKTINLSVGDRIAIDEIEGVIVVYSGYKQ